MNDTVVAIVGAFFIIGILVGIIAVVAMSVLRAERHGAPGDPEDPPDYEARGPGEPPPGLPWDGTGPDGHPHWPPDADNDFSGR
jgi:hypothetical protein